MFGNLLLLFRRSGGLFLHDNKLAGEQNVIDEQRRSAFIYACLAMFAADVALWFLGMDAFGDLLYEMLHPVHFLLTLSLFVSYLLNRLSVIVGVSILCTANQLSVLFEMWQCMILETTTSQIYLILGYMVMAGLNMALVMVAYIRVLPFVLGGLAIVAYGICSWGSGESILIGMFPIFLICFFVIALGGHHLSGNVHRLEHEKTVLKDEEQKILNLLELNKSELMACISLAKEKGLSTEQTGTLLDLIGKKARENIRDNVSYYYRQQEIDYAGLRSCLPKLTPSEVEICDLILKEKKMKEILRILGKSESNITSQRTNIRRKLGLSPSDNLRDALVKMTKIK